MKERETEQTTNNPQVLWKMRRKHVLGCSYCKPHRSENSGRKPRPDKYKNKR